MFYTDGSASGGLLDGGSAAVITQGDPEALHVLDVSHQQGPAFTSSFETEAWAHVMVVSWVDQVVGEKRLLVCIAQWGPSPWSYTKMGHLILDKNLGLFDSTLDALTQ